MTDDELEQIFRNIHDRLYSLGATGELSESKIHEAVDFARADYERFKQEQTKV
jgi:hypothetical protein